MDVINVLDAQVANMIAAGEVVERPASALKELLENALDAGATSVSAEIKDGGVTLIRVSDNGVGISESDLPKTVLRHATSKIKSGFDIDGVKTLGFRGEALAAIASVSKLSIISRQADKDCGCLLTSGGEGSTAGVPAVGMPAVGGSTVGGSTVGVPIVGGSAVGGSTVGVPIVGGSAVGGSTVGVPAVGVPTVGGSAVGGSTVGVPTVGGLTIEEVGCPVGTTVMVEGLFYNTPARRKFLKRDSAEAAACRGVAEKIAVSNPAVAFRFSVDGEEKFSTSGDGKLKNAVADALGGAFAKGLIEVQGGADEVKVSGYVSSPEASRGNSASQMAFVNGRYVLSKTVFAALREAYRSYLPRDRYPASVLFLELPYKFVDVNVHPSKTEVKFASERKVYEAVYYAVRSALQRSDAFTGDEKDILLRKGDIKTAPAIAPAIAPAVAPVNASDAPFAGGSAAGSSAPDAASMGGSAKPDMSEGHGSARHGGRRCSAPTDSAALKQSAVFDAASYAPGIAENREPTDTALPRTPSFVPRQNRENAVLALHSPRLSEFFARVEAERHEAERNQAERHEAERHEAEQTEAAQSEMEKPPAFRYIGEAFDAYLIAETADALYIIDKHAAHERILYERLRKSTRAESQSLLLPYVAELSASAARCVLENAAYLSSLGFDIEEFGEKSVAVRALPAALSGKEDVRALLEQFAESLSTGGALPFEERCDRALFTMACKAALKAGVHNSAHDNVWILERLFEDGSIKYCPHGRPVAKVFTKREADKWFDR